MGGEKEFFPKYFKILFSFPNIHQKGGEKMDENKKNQIAWVLLKRYLKHEIRLGDIGNFKRNMGEISKEMGISQDDLMEFSELIAREIFEEQIARLKKSR